MADLLRAFLSLAEITALRGLAETTCDWTPGRQRTGYDILPIQALEDPRPAVVRALAQLGTPFKDRWDAYLIRYRDGAHIPPHVDPAPLGRSHRRLNALLVPASTGGALRIGGVPVALEIGDAVVFYPDREEHEVAPVTGTRLLFSVGAWI